MQRREAEVLQNKDRTLAATQAALVACQKKQQELEEQVRKRDKWINVLEGWMSSAFSFMNGVVSLRLRLPRVSLSTEIVCFCLERSIVCTPRSTELR